MNISRKTFINGLKHAFALSDGTSPQPTAPQQAAIDRVLREVVKRRLTVPAEMLLETCRPLNFVGSQLLVFFSPLMKVALGAQGQDDFARFLEQRDSIDYLLERLEHMTQQDEKSTSQSTASQTGDGTK